MGLTVAVSGSSVLGRVFSRAASDRSWLSSAKRTSPRRDSASASSGEDTSVSSMLVVRSHKAGYSSTSLPSTRSVTEGGNGPKSHSLTFLRRHSVLDTSANAVRAVERANVAWTAFKYAENTGQFQVIREQAGTFADSIKLWSEA